MSQWYSENWPGYYVGGTELSKVKFESPGKVSAILRNLGKVCADCDRYGEPPARCSDKGIRQVCKREKWSRQEVAYYNMPPKLPVLPIDTVAVVIFFLVTGIAAFCVIIMTSVLWCTTTAKKALAKPVYGGPVSLSAPAPVHATQLSASPVAMIDQMAVSGLVRACSP